MKDQQRRDELRRFLQDRRSRIAPADVAITSIGRRRVSGLRREEVAILAGISVSWYTALESGEDRAFSEDTVLAVADALRLTDSERAYMMSLVATPDQANQIEPPSSLILDAMNAVVYPSCVNTAEWDILACNEAFRRIWGLEESELPVNTLERLFLHPTTRAMHGEHIAANAAPLLAKIRFDLARHPDLVVLERLRQRVLADDELRKVWDTFEVRASQIPSTGMLNSLIGPFCYETLSLPITGKLLRMVIYVPDRPSRERLATALR